MKTKALAIITIILIFCAIHASGQGGVATGKFDPSEYVYWFYLKVEKKIDKEMNRYVYQVRTLSKTPKYGAFASYEKDVWRCLNGGQQLVIGPFRDYNVAKQSIAIYDLAKLSSSIRVKEIQRVKDSSQIEDSYFCYYLKYDFAPRTHRIILKRVAARIEVEPITLSDFMDQFTEGITFEMLAMGPFFTKQEAEESKRLNRLEEN